MDKISIFDVFREEGILKEAEGDETTAAADTQQPAANTPAATDTETQTTDTTTDTDVDADFNIDTSLDMGDDNMGGGNDTDEDNMSTSSGDGNTADSGTDEEINPYNTNMFAALSAEEQKIKLIEQKKLYQSMYDSITELLNRVNDFDTEENNLVIVSRISNVLYDLKKYIADYIIYDIPIKSYYDNEVMYNRFLSVINSIANVVDKYDKKLEKDEEN